MVMRLDNSFKIAYQRHYVFCASFCTPYFFFFFFSLELYKEKHYRSPFGFIDFIFSYKNCIMKYTFRYSVVHWVLFYKTYSKKYKNIYIHIYINQLIWLYKKDSLPILVTLLYCTPGNVGLASLWRRKASHQHWRDVYCCSPGLISKLSLCSLHTDCPMCCVSWTSATRVQSSCSLCTQTEHVTMIQAILRSPFPSRRCSLWDLHRRNRSIALRGWHPRSLLLLHGRGPSCRADLASISWK